MPDFRVPGKSTCSEQREWRLRRNIALSPQALALCFGLAAAGAVVIAAGFAWQGLWVVLPFAGIEVIALGVAYVAYARHAADGDRLELDASALRIESVRGARYEWREWPADRVRVELAPGADPAITLRAGIAAVQIGRQVAPERRVQVASELRTALRDRAALAAEAR